MKAAEYLRVKGALAEREASSCTNPAVGIKLFKLKARSRFLEVEELARFAVAVETLRYRTTRDFLWMCLLTAARRSNVAAMRWEDINLERGIWTIPETKNGDPHVLPLVKDAISLLQQRKNKVTGPWVFPSQRMPWLASFYVVLGLQFSHRGFLPELLAPVMTSAPLQVMLSCGSRFNVSRIGGVI